MQQKIFENTTVSVLQKQNETDFILLQSICSFQAYFE